jgi:hypothetical protein
MLGHVGNNVCAIASGRGGLYAFKTVARELAAVIIPDLLDGLRGIDMCPLVEGFGIGSPGKRACGLGYKLYTAGFFEQRRGHTNLFNSLSARDHAVIDQKQGFMVRERLRHGSAELRRYDQVRRLVKLRHGRWHEEGALMRHRSQRRSVGSISSNPGSALSVSNFYPVG